MRTAPAERGMRTVGVGAVEERGRSSPLGSWWVKLTRVEVPFGVSTWATVEYTAPWGSRKPVAELLVGDEEMVASSPRPLPAASRATPSAEAGDGNVLDWGGGSNETGRFDQEKRMAMGAVRRY